METTATRTKASVTSLYVFRILYSDRPCIIELCELGFRLVLYPFSSLSINLHRCEHVRRLICIVSSLGKFCLSPPALVVSRDRDYRSVA